MSNPFLIRNTAGNTAETPDKKPKKNTGSFSLQPALSFNPAAGQPAIEPLTPALSFNPAAVQQPPKPEMRSFGDVQATRSAILDRVLKAAGNLRPVENERYSLTLHDVHYAEKEDPSPDDIKQTILENGTLTKTLKGTWVLKDNQTGSETKRSTVVAKVPYLLDNGTFLRNGTKYAMRNQSRLLPGAYVRRKENGEFEAHINADMKEGNIHHYGIEPETGVINVIASGSKTPIYGLAKAMGASDEEMKNAWGEELFDINRRKYQSSQITKLYEKFARGKKTAASEDERKEALKNAMENISFDPDVMEQTLGKRYERLTKDVLLDTTKKLIGLSRGEVQSDDRDSLAFQEVYGPEDIFEERLSKDAGRFRRQLFNNLIYRFKGDINKLPAGALTRQLDGGILTSGLAENSEEINSLMVFDKAYSLTRLGEGGIASLDAVPDAARNVNPSHLGLIDASRTPESLRAGIDTYIAVNARKGSDRRLYTPVLDKQGSELMVSPKDMIRKTVAIASEYRKAAEDEYIPAMQKGKEAMVPKSEVDYLIPHFEGAFSPLANLIPLKSAAQGNRVAMGSRFLAQALPLNGGEAPFVQTAVPGTNGQRSYYEEFGKDAGAVFAEQPGTVLEATDRHILVENADGTQKKINLSRYSPSNRKSYLNVEPVVTVGQRVGSGDILAKSNMTDDKGAIALGKNARVIMTPWKGLNFEDGILISKSFAEKMSSQHMYRHQQEWTDDYKKGKHAFMGIFPSTFSKQQLNNMDEHGVILPGTAVKHGDPLILAARSTEDSKKRKKRLYSDVSLTWDHHDDGIVTDVYHSDKGTSVLVKTSSPMREGDKLCLSGDHDVLTRAGWKPIADVTLEDEVACLEGDIARLTGGTLIWEQPLATHKYPAGGRMFHIRTEYIDILATEDHRMAVAVWNEKNGRERLESGLFPIKELAARENGFLIYGYDEEKKIDSLCNITKKNWSVIENYREPVYCLTVRTEVFFIRRNGKCCWTGNSGRFGSKGVVSIIPDDEMPMTEDGMVAEVVVSPGGTVSRGNPAQIAELALGKIAKLTGKPYKIEDFEDIDDIMEFVDSELKKHGVSANSPLIDRKTGRKIYNLDGSGAANGYQWMMKLHHTSEAKGSARGMGGYSADETPTKGGDEGAKRLSASGLNALVAHGAYQTFMDAKYNRGQANEDYWLQYMKGGDPQSKKTPLVYEKFVNSLKASGINVEPSNDRLNVMAMTSKDVQTLAGDREVQKGDALRDGNNGFVSGGLFDPVLFGMNGDRWAKVTPVVPLLNPVMEEPARILLGLKQKEMQAVMSGEMQYKSYGTGMNAVKSALEDINIERSMTACRNQIREGHGAQRDAAVRALGYLKASESTGIHPRDWMLSSIPVIPPKFRPISMMKDSDIPLVDDANYLYKLFIDTNNGLKDLRKITRNTHKEEYGLYDSYKQVTGLADPTHPKLVQRNVRGLLRAVFGVGSSKYSMVQRNLIGTTVDTVGRGVVISDPDLGLDEIGIPEEKAWETYRPYIMHQLTKRGTPWALAAKAIEERKPDARAALIREMEQRPVVATRDPILHKYSMLALKPKLVAGDSIKMNQFVNKGFGLDADGNCCDFDEEIILRISKSENLRGCGSLDSVAVTGEAKAALPEFIAKLGENTMSVYGKEFVQTFKDGRAITMKIGLFPAIGDPVKDKNGADVYCVPDGIEILSYDVEKGEQVWCPAVSFTVEQNASSVEVETTGGRTVIVSDNESIAAYNHDTGKLDKICPKDAIGRLVPVIKRNPHIGGRFSRNIGWFYGALISDGWVSDRTVGYAKVDESKRNKFIEVARNEICDNFLCYTYSETAAGQKNKLADSVKIHLNGRDLAEKVFSCIDGEQELAEGDRNALRKCIPPQLLNEGSRECLLGLLSGLLEGDGSMGWNKSFAKRRAGVRYSTSSKRLVDDIRRLGVKLGFVVSVTETPPRNMSKTAYNVNLSVPDAWKIFHELEFVSESAQQFQRDFLTEKPSFSPKDIVPVMKTEAKTAEQFLPAKRNTPQEILTMRGAWSKAIKTGYLCRDTAVRYLKFLPDDMCPELRKHVVNESVSWDRYQSVKQTEPREVFDVAVEGTKVFALSNGLIVFDTMNFHVPKSEEAVREAYELLLPSKSLLKSSDMKSAMPQIISENAGGLYLASLPAEKGKKAREFVSWDDVRKAYQRGDLSIDEPVEVMRRS